MGIGLSGSGKTTVLKAFAERYKYAYVGIDDIRTNLGVRTGELSTDAAKDEMRKQVRDQLREQKTVVVESSFVDRQYRREFLDFARSCGAEKIQGIFLDTPSEIAWKRNLARERVVPENIYKHRMQQLEEHPPIIEDGFDSLFTLNEYQELIEAETLTARKEFGSERLK